MLPRPEILLTPTEMSRVDAAAIASGISGQALMLRAGEAVAACVLRHYPAALRFAVLCGPGNNGGDGYVAAEALVRCGANVRVFAFGDPERLRGDARIARAGWSGRVEALEAYMPQAGDVVIDAVFGAGLARDVPDLVQQVIADVTAAAIPVIAVDLPSGIDGASGKLRGAAFRAERSVTFVTRKPGHVLLPGRDHCGTVEVFDIGIPHRIVAAEAAGLWVNGPSLFQSSRRPRSAEDHKIGRAHV